MKRMNVIYMIFGVASTLLLAQAASAASNYLVTESAPVYPGDMRAQIRQVCENIGRALRSVGADFSDVVKTTTFTTDVDEYHRVSDERFKYFKRDLPTSALIGVKRLADPDLMIEIEAMAVIPTDRAK